MLAITKTEPQTIVEMNIAKINVSPKRVLAVS